MDLQQIEKIIHLGKNEKIKKIDMSEGATRIVIEFFDENFRLNSCDDVKNIEIRKSGIDIENNISKNKNISSMFHEITSPFVGTFFLTASPGGPSFVKRGDRVSKGTTLCILEAMKIMNEIESDVDGVIEEVLLENETFVEYGQLLFKIRKS